MAPWHVNIDQKPFGPVDESVLYSWVAQGRLGPDDLIWSEGMPDWVQAVAVFPEWFGQPPRTNVTPPPHRPPPSVVLRPHRGGTILTFGIIGLFSIPGFLPVCCCLLPATITFAILACVMGKNDLLAMQQGLMDPSGERMTRNGRTCGIIGIVAAFAGMAFSSAMFLAGGGRYNINF